MTFRLLHRWRGRGAWLGLAAAWLACVPAHADQVMSLSLRQALDLALQRNTELRIAAADTAQAQAAVAQAGAAGVPRVSLEAGASRSDDALTVLGMKLSQRRATFDDFGAGQFLQALNANSSPLGLAPDNLNRPAAANDFHAGVQAELPLYTGGRLAGLREQAREQLAAARAGDREARQKVVQQVVGGFDAVLSAQAFGAVTRQALRAAQDEYDTASRLWRAGVVVRSDVLSAQVALEEARLRASQAEDAVQQETDRLRVAMGLPQSVQLRLQGEVDVPMPQGDPQAWTRQALDANPGIQALRHQLQAAGGGVQVARSQLYPQIGAMARVDSHDPNPGFAAHSYTIGAQLRWTLFDGGVARAEVDQALAARTRLQARLDAAGQALELQIRQSWRDALQAQHEQDMRTLALSQAEEAERIVQRRYADGVGTLVEWQRALAQLDRARAELVLARHRVQLQRTALRLALGRLDPDDLKNSTSPVAPASPAASAASAAAAPATPSAVLSRP
ncbi:MAG: TolC family protein [Betaproteobacteria bacterium]|nr:TolC family protein [Betaproteobacteria bacterium]